MATGYNKTPDKDRTSKNVFQYGAPIGREQYDDSEYGARKDTMQQPAAEPDPSPPTKVVLDFHKNAPTDTRADDIHHTLGSGPTQAASGDHDHSGGPSGALLLDGYVLTGSKATPATVMPSLINCLVRLGATDNTT